VDGLTILAETDAYLIEYEAGTLTVARYSDGHCLVVPYERAAGMFRDCLKTHSIERTIECFIRMGEAAYRRMTSKPGYRSHLGSLDGRDAKGWEPLYKPHRMPRKSDECNN